MNFKSRLIAHEILSGSSFGVFVAVQGILILEKGVEVWQIGLLFGAVVVATSLFELPFGALADIHGRIKIYRISRVFYLVALVSIIFTFNFWVLLGIMVLLGIGEALNSGTVDAWAVEQVNKAGENDKLQSYISYFQASMAGGLAVGAIVGGYIPQFMPPMEGYPPTTWNLTIAAALAALHLLLTPFLFHEGEGNLEKVDKKEVVDQIKSTVKFSVTHVKIRDLLILSATLGAAMIFIEAYWQPQLTHIAGRPTYSLLGWATAGYFAMAIAGPILIDFIANKTNAPPFAQLMVLPFVLVAALLVYSIQVSISPYIAAYMAVMLIMSMFHPPASTLLNNETSDDIRSTMLSIFSLVLRGGGAVSAFAFSGLIKKWDIATVTQILAAFVLVVAIVRLVKSKRANSSS